MDVKPKNRAWVKDAAIIFLAVLLVLTFFSNTIRNRTLTEVATVGVTDGSIVAKVRGTGTVVANGINQVTAGRTVEIQSVMLKSGQEVNAGDVLFVLGAGESEELEAAREELRSLEISRLYEELDTAREQMGQSVITAPYDGSVIYLSDLVRGSYVNAFNPLVYIADDSRMSIETDYIMESIVKGADRIYAHVGGNTYDLEYVPMESSELFAKTMSGEKIMSSFKIIDADDQIGMGDYAVVCVESNSVKDTLLIPRNALYIESSGRYVYVVEDGAHVRRDVQVGHMANHIVEIRSGLEEGEIVYVKD